jgi:hypothetical protein
MLVVPGAFNNHPNAIDNEEKIKQAIAFREGGTIHTAIIQVPYLVTEQSSTY